MKKLISLLGVCAFVVGANAALITFDEYAVGTQIDDEYAALGVTFSAGPLTGALPVIAMDGAMPTDPILRPQGEAAGNWLYSGDFYFEFDAPVYDLSFMSGYWDTPGAAQIDLFDADGNLILAGTNMGMGPELMDYSGYAVSKVYFNSTNDPAGGDIDNLSFSLAVPEPATISLLGLGLLGLVGFARRKRS